MKKPLKIQTLKSLLCEFIRYMIQCVVAMNANKF